MRKLKIGNWLMNLAVIVFFIQNFYFGWNKVPMSTYEEYADNLVRYLFLAGLGIYLFPLIKMYEDKVKGK